MYSTTIVCYEHENELTYQFSHTGILVNSTWAWSVRMPHSVYGLRRSCIVIPCSFSYSSYPPYNAYRVVWYQYVDRGYPLVYDSWYPKEVIDKYRGRTSIYKGSHLDCSLMIDDLSFSHDGDRIYTWIDPENVGSSNFKFFDVTALIHVKCKCYIYLPSCTFLYNIVYSLKNPFCENGALVQFNCYWSFATVNI